MLITQKVSTLNTTQNIVGSLFRGVKCFISNILFAGSVVLFGLLQVSCDGGSSSSSGSFSGDSASAGSSSGGSQYKFLPGPNSSLGSITQYQIVFPQGLGEGNRGEPQAVFDFSTSTYRGGRPIIFDWGFVEGQTRWRWNGPQIIGGFEKAGLELLADSENVGWSGRSVVLVATSVGRGHLEDLQGNRLVGTFEIYKAP